MYLLPHNVFNHILSLEKERGSGMLRIFSKSLTINDSLTAWLEGEPGKTVLMVLLFFSQTSTESFYSSNKRYAPHPIFPCALKGCAAASGRVTGTDLQRGCRALRAFWDTKFLLFGLEETALWSWGMHLQWWRWRSLAGGSRKGCLCWGGELAGWKSCHTAALCFHF